MIGPFGGLSVTINIDVNSDSNVDHRKLKQEDIAEKEECSMGDDRTVASL